MNQAIDRLYSEFRKSRKISTDTRKILPGSIFFALKGENFNGNAFAMEALGAGAVLSVVDERLPGMDDRCLFVEDVLLALQNLARKGAGEAVGFINIADARVLTDLGLATRSREGWDITALGSSLLARRRRMLRRPSAGLRRAPASG